jgi:transposase
VVGRRQGADRRRVVRRWSERLGGGRRYWLRPQQVYTWRRLARDGVLALPSEAALGFVPVIAAESEPGPLPATPSGIVEIEITGTVIRVAPGVDWRHLRDVLRAVKAAR